VLKGTGVAIAALTQTQGYTDGGTMKFVGLDADVEMALYLTELVKGAHDRVWQTYRREQMPAGLARSEQNAHRNGVTMGFANTLAFKSFLTVSTRMPVWRAMAVMPWPWVIRRMTVARRAQISGLDPLRRPRLRRPPRRGASNLVILRVIGRRPRRICEA